jgi:hypothetical protein
MKDVHLRIYVGRKIFKNCYLYLTVYVNRHAAVLTDMSVAIIALGYDVVYVGTDAS